MKRILNRVAMDSCRMIAHLSREKGRVLMFHDIGNNGASLNIDTPSFEKILKKFSRVCISLDNIETSKEKFVALTFDDVMESFYTNGYPLLKRYHCPFTLFVSISLLDQPGYITTAMLKDMAKDPLCTVGSHGMKHCYFATYSKKEALEDMRNSKLMLQELTGQPVSLFAFPYGSFTACGFRTHKLVTSVYKYGFSTINAPIANKNFLPFGFLPRINIDNNTIKNFDL